VTFDLWGLRVPAGRMMTTPRAHPRDFRDDVVSVARNSKAPIAEIAKDFGISKSCLRNWLHVADVEARRRPASAVVVELTEFLGATASEPVVGAGDEVPWWAAAYLSQANLPGNDVPASA
jgi:transposase